MERFVIIVNGFQPLTIITKRSILDVAAALDPPLIYKASLELVLETNTHTNATLTDNILGYQFPPFRRDRSTRGGGK